MSFTSPIFFVFVAVCLVGFYIIPKRFQYIWLLIFSYIYYGYADISIIVFLMFSTIITFCGAKKIQSVNNSELDKKIKNRNKKLVLLTVLICNFGVLGVVKYANFVIENINAVAGTTIGSLDILLPLGLSFYTFQTVGYILDVYWERIEAEKNLTKYALFVSFFPQILQGPISRWNDLSKELFAEHSFKIENIKQGFVRVLWGFYKKLIIADTAGSFADPIFNHPDMFPGLSIAGVLFYCAQLYGDFSGGMDIVIGISEMLDIKLVENFRQPFFAKSITDFWHRWHITLGTWMKDYVFYPFALSKFANKIGKVSKKAFGKSIGRVMPVALGNLLVFFVVGVWHGAAWKFIAYGMYNGIIIAFSELMAKQYRKWKTGLHIKDESKGFKLFQIIRTFILVNISWFLDRGDTVGIAWTMFKNSFTHFDLGPLLDGSLRGTDVIQMANNSAFNMLSLASLGLGIIVLFIVSVLKEKGINVKEKIASSYLLMFLACGFLILMPALLGQPNYVTGGFIYAQF